MTQPAAHRHEASYRFPQSSNNGMDYGTCVCGSKVSRQRVGLDDGSIKSSTWIARETMIEDAHAEMVEAQTPEPLDVNVVDLFDHKGAYRGEVADVKLFADRIDFYHEDGGRKLHSVSVAAFLSLVQGLWLDMGMDICLTVAATQELQAWTREVFSGPAGPWRDFDAEIAAEIARDGEEALAMLNGRDVNRRYPRQTAEPAVEPCYREFAEAAMETRSYQGALDLLHAEALQMDEAMSAFVEAVDEVQVISAPVADAAAVTAALSGSSAIVVLADAPEMDPEPALAQIAAAADLPIERVREVYRAIVNGSLGMVVFDE